MNKIKSFFGKEDGEVNLIAIIVISIVVIAVAILFRGQLETLVTDIFQVIKTQLNGVSTE